MGRSSLIDLSQSRWRAAESTAQNELWFLHGYASNEDDLFGLARLIPADWNVRSLQALAHFPRVVTLGTTYILMPTECGM